MIGHGNHHGIDVVAIQQLAKIVIALAVLSTVSVINLLDVSLEMIGIDIARGDYLAVRQRQEGFRVARPLPAHSDHT